MRDPGLIDAEKQIRRLDELVCQQEPDLRMELSLIWRRMYAERADTIEAGDPLTRQRAMMAFVVDYCQAIKPTVGRYIPATERVAGSA